MGAAGLAFIPLIGDVAKAGVKPLLGKPVSAVADVVKETPVDFAKRLQDSGNYPGVDVFRNITLKKGTIIYGGYPGQNHFYTIGSAIGRTGDSASGLSRGLQIGKHRTHGYRPIVTAYEVLENTPAAFGRALANPQHGTGRLPQLVVPGYQKALRPIYDMPLNP